MMKVFSKCSVVLFGLMLFFGNSDSCYGMKDDKNDKEIPEKNQENPEDPFANEEEEENNFKTNEEEVKKEENQKINDDDNNKGINDQLKGLSGARSDQKLNQEGKPQIIPQVLKPDSTSGSRPSKITQVDSQIEKREPPQEDIKRNAGIVINVKKLLFGAYTERDAKLKIIYILGPLFITMITSGIGGYLPYKNILGGFNVYTCNIPGFFPNFLRFLLQIGLSYKINNKFSIIIFGLSTIKILACLIPLAFVRRTKIHWLKYLNVTEICVVSINLSKYFSFRISIGALIISLLFNSNNKRIRGKEKEIKNDEGKGSGYDVKIEGIPITPTIINNEEEKPNTTGTINIGEDDQENKIDN